jgi:hypothetical protein
MGGGVGAQSAPIAGIAEIARHRRDPKSRISPRINPDNTDQERSGDPVIARDLIIGRARACHRLQTHYDDQVRTHSSRVEVRPHGLVQWELAALVTAEVEVAGKPTLGECYRGKCGGVTVDVIRRFKVHADYNAADG